MDWSPPGPRLLCPWNSPGKNSGRPFPSPGCLPNPGIEPRSSTLQTCCLPSEPSVKSEEQWPLFLWKSLALLSIAVHPGRRKETNTQSKVTFFLWVNDSICWNLFSKKLLISLTVSLSGQHWPYCKESCQTTEVTMAPPGLNSAKR